MNELSWKIKVPIFKNNIIIKQLSIAIGIPFGAVTILFLIIKAYYGLILVGATFLLGYLLVLFIFRGTYDITYIMNGKGIQCKNQPQQEKQVKRLSLITFVFGLFTRNLTVSGAGLLAGSRTNIFIPWKRIRKVKCLEKQKCIMLHGGFSENVAVFCTNENFNEVNSIITENLKGE